jgi:hypothetical protein
LDSFITFKNQIRINCIINELYLITFNIIKILKILDHTTVIIIFIIILYYCQKLKKIFMEIIYIKYINYKYYVTNKFDEYFHLKFFTIIFHGFLIIILLIQL